MAGNICLVTGGTAGIGAVTARELARRGATVGIVGRSAERLTAMVRSIEKESGSTALVPLRADLSSQAEIRRLAGEVRERFPHLDVLVNKEPAWRDEHLAVVAELASDGRLRDDLGVGVGEDNERGMPAKFQAEPLYLVRG